MKRILLLVLLLGTAASLFFLLNPSEPKVQEEVPLKPWDMRKEIQKASDTERNPWKRDS